MNETFLGITAVAAFFVVFPLFWMSIVWLIGKLGGWSALAAQYPADLPPRGEAFSWRTARLGFFGSYSNSLNVTVSDEGIHLAPLIFFKFGHASIFIPWEAVSQMHINIFGFFSSADLRVTPKDRGGPIKLKLYGEALVKSLQKHGVRE